jgi:iron complex transport system permease protein
VIAPEGPGRRRRRRGGRDRARLHLRRFPCAAVRGVRGRSHGGCGRVRASPLRRQDRGRHDRAHRAGGYAIAGAGIGFLFFLADDEELRGAVFWTLGSLGTATWDKITIAAPFVLVSVAALVWLAQRLDVLVLGDDAARHVGLHPERSRRTLIVLAALATGAAVSVSGMIGFVGLVVPHVVRLVVGPGHRLLVPASALAGATLLVLADLAARTLAEPAELPLGVLTALIGGPFFLWLLVATRRTHGGWG